MDTGSHTAASETSRSEGRLETCSTLEQEAIRQIVFNHRSETVSERNERQVGEVILMSSLDTIQGTEGEGEEEDESDSREDSNGGDEEESEAPQVAEVKSAKSSGGGLEGRGVDG